MELHEIRLVHRVVAGRHVFTSPDMPELWVAHADLEVAKSEIEPVVRAIRAAKGEGEVIVTPATLVVEAA